MKKIAIIFRNRKNPEAIASINGTLRELYADYADIHDYYLDELDEVQHVEADIFVVNGKNSVPILRKYADVFGRLIMLDRSIANSNIEILKKIPDASEVLVVNDTLDSSIEAAEMLSETGFEKLNFTPFNPADGLNPFYQNFDYAITPDEMPLVPNGIRHVINIGYRKLGFRTIIQIKNALGVDDEALNLKLMKYVSTIIEPVDDFRNSYFNSYLKSRMLNECVYDASSAYVLINSKGQVVYSNRKAEIIFGKSFDGKLINIFSAGEELAEIIEKQGTVYQRPISIFGHAYIVDKSIISIGDLEMGYMITLHDEVVIKEMERKLNDKLVQKGLFARYNFNDLKGSSKALSECVEIAKKAAQTDYTLLLCAESGVGKELFAQAIHNYSGRSNQPFVGVNCAAIPENLLESELFGYEGGAFTGASKSGKLGYFELANHGTIFLDEIGDMAPGLQTRLLRVLQERQIMRIGGDKVIDIDVRIIVATNKDLKKEVEMGNFRMDLYYRLNALQINIPPLRERIEDIPPLLKEFLGTGAAMSSDDIARLQNYTWPGNVRELENCVLYYKTLGKLPPHFYENEPKPLKQVMIPRERMTEDGLKVEILEILNGEMSMSHGMGRLALIEKLKEKGISVSDVRMRKIMAELAEKGLILVGKGRKGTEITEAGIAYLT